MDSIRIDVSLPTHPLSQELARLLCEPLAFGRMVRLWCWAAGNAPDGFITGSCAVRVVEEAAGWTGEPGVFVDAALEVGFLSRVGDTLVLHGWQQRSWSDLCTRKQALRLGHYGIDADGLTFRDATEILAAIRRNGWKAPSSRLTPHPPRVH